MEQPKGDSTYTTGSGIPVKGAYTADDVVGRNLNTDLGAPGSPPFTRGAYPGGYRERLWRIFQLSGHGTAEDEGERIRYLLKTGETGFIMEGDISSWLLYDVDDPEVVCRKDDVGLFGAPLMSLRDWEIILEGIPIQDTYCHPGGVTPMFSPFAHACYFSVAEKRHIPLGQLRGTGEGDFFLGYLSTPSKGLIPPRHGLRLNCDLIEFCVEKLPRWVPVSVASYNARENGIPAFQEMALALANSTAYIEEILRRGKHGIDDFAYSVAGFGMAIGRDFLENVATFRATRRMWYRLLSDRYGARAERSLRLRIHALVQGSDYTYQQPLNNIVRGTYHALSAAMAGVQSMGVSAYDEAICTPSEAAHLISIRTQQILQHESGIANVADPFGGSYYIEWLTNEIENRAWDYLKQIEERGGFIKTLESGWLYRESMNAMLERARKAASGETRLVGVNCFQLEDEPHHVSAFRHNPRTWQISKDRLDQLRRERDQQKWREAMDELRRVSEGQENVMPAMMKAAQAYVTAGEVGRLWREMFSTWNAPLPM